MKSRRSRIIPNAVCAFHFSEKLVEGMVSRGYPRAFANAHGAAIVGARGTTPYESVDDVWRRAGTPRTAIERLAEADAFHALGDDRRQGLWKVRGLGEAPLPLFAAADSREAATSAEGVEPAVTLRPLTAGREVVEDYAALQLSLRAHPLTFLRQDAALPERLAETARERGAMLDLTSPGDQLDSAREHLMNFTAVAAANYWIHEAERIDAAAMTLGPREGDDDGMILFEIAVWRARLIGDIEARTRFLASDILRLAKHPPLHDQAIIAVRHFGRHLPGHYATPFVEALGELLATS